MGYDDRIIIKTSSGTIKEQERDDIYPRLPSPYPVGRFNPPGSTVPVRAAQVLQADVVTSIPQNTKRGYDYSRWLQRYDTGLGGTPGGLNDLYSRLPYDQYTYYNDRAVVGSLGIFEIISGYEDLVPYEGYDEEGEPITLTRRIERDYRLTLTGFPTYFNPYVGDINFAEFRVQDYSTNLRAFYDVSVAAWPGPNGDGNHPWYNLKGNFITFRP